MAALPIVSGAQCIVALNKIGYEVVRQKGSHVRLTAPGRRSVTVPIHHELDRGTLRSIIRTADLTPEEFIALLG